MSSNAEAVKKLLKLFDIRDPMNYCANCNNYCHHANKDLILDNKNLAKIPYIFKNNIYASDINLGFTELKIPLHIETVQYGVQFKIWQAKEIVNSNTTSAITPDEITKLPKHDGMYPIMKSTQISDCWTENRIQTIYHKEFDGYKTEEYEEPFFITVPKTRTETYTELEKRTHKVERSTIVHRHNYLPTPTQYYVDEEYEIPITKTREVEYEKKKFVRMDKKERQVEKFKNVPTEYETNGTNCTETRLLYYLLFNKDETCEKCTCIDCTNKENGIVIDYKYNKKDLIEQWFDHFKNTSVRTCLVCGGFHHSQINILTAYNKHNFKQCDPVFSPKINVEFELDQSHKYFGNTINKKYILNAIPYNKCTTCSCYRCIAYDNTNIIKQLFFSLDFADYINNKNLLFSRITKQIPDYNCLPEKSFHNLIGKISRVLHSIKIY
jgi:hypothetical protein